MSFHSNIIVCNIIVLHTIVFITGIVNRKKRDPDLGRGKEGMQCGREVYLPSTPNEPMNFWVPGGSEGAVGKIAMTA